MLRSSWTVLCTAGCVAALASACGGAKSSTPPKELPLLASATIDPAHGGSVAVPGGVTVLIPPGALSTTTVVTIRDGLETPTGAVTRVYALGPSGTTFAQPVTVSFPVPATSTAGAIWTKQEGDPSYHSVPTTVASGVASAEVSHFSFHVYGPVDFSGTWAGQIAFTSTPANGTTSGPLTLMQARDVVQSVGDATYYLTNSSGNTATCTGTVIDAEFAATCTTVNFDATCDATYVPTGWISGTSWYSAYQYTLHGAHCGAAGLYINVPGSTIHKLDGPPLDVSGTYAYSGEWTNTKPGVPPLSGTSAGTKVRTQAPPARSRMRSTILTGGSGSCLGAVIGFNIFSHCRNFGDGGATFEGDFVGTLSVGPPRTIRTSGESTITNGNYTHSSGTTFDTLQ